MAKPTRASHNFEALLSYLKKGHNYEPPADSLTVLKQTAQQRLKDLKLSSVDLYTDFLHKNPSETASLLDAVIGERGRFFRDEADWNLLKNELLPRLKMRNETGYLRFWTVACGKGQESYSLAMLLCELFGEQFFRERIKIFATDVDENCLQVARSAHFSQSEMENVPPALRDKYFTPVDKRFVFHNELRRSLTFGRHVLTEDPAISRMDLILCRQVLVYSDANTQKSIVARLAAALREDGWLLLGRGEVLPADAPLQQLQREPTVYVRTTRGEQHLPDGAAAIRQADATGTNYFEAAQDCSPVATICLDNNRLLMVANARARKTFGIVNQDLGRPLQDLEISYRPLELRSLLDQVDSGEQMSLSKRVSNRGDNGRAQLFDVYIYPLVEPATNKRVGFSIQYSDVTEFHETESQLFAVNQQLKTANEELQSAHEELETTNEELHSSNEELETANEELQSTNEELETMNEELQSANSELAEANEMQRSTAETVDETGSFLQSILSSMRSAVIVLNDKLQVVLWNDRCRDFWGLRADEVIGYGFLSLDIGLPVEKLKTPLRTFMQLHKDFEEVILDATNRRGADIRCTVRITPLADPDQQGIVLLIDDDGSDSRGKQ